MYLKMVHFLFLKDFFHSLNHNFLSNPLIKLMELNSLDIILIIELALMIRIDPLIQNDPLINLTSKLRSPHNLFNVGKAIRKPLYFLEKY